MHSEIRKVLSYDMIINLDLESIPINQQVDFLLNTLSGNKCNISKITNDSNHFFDVCPSVSIFMNAPEEFSSLFYKKYVKKEEFLLKGSEFPTFLLSALAGVDSICYTDIDYALQYVRLAKKLKMNINAKTPVKNTDISVAFESEIITGTLPLRRGFSKNKNITDLALLTCQYELAMSLMKPPFSVKPTIQYSLTEDDLFNYVTNVLLNDNEKGCAKFDYMEKVKEIREFFKIPKSISIVDALFINENNVDFENFLDCLIEKKNKIENFLSLQSYNLKEMSPEEIIVGIISSLFTSLEKMEKDSTSYDYKNIKNKIIKVMNSYDFLKDDSDNILDRLTGIEKKELLKNINKDKIVSEKYEKKRL